MDRHGISGPKNSNCGIRYTESAKSCVYLVWENNTIYFTRYRKQYKVTIDRPAFTSIFRTAIEIYKVLIGNEANRIKMQCISTEELYPDYNT